MKHLSNYVFRWLAGNMLFQKTFEIMHNFSLKGMNIGSGASTATSGEKNVLKYIYKKLADSKTPIIFDVGANVGNYSLLCQSIFQNKATIFAFEPSQFTYQKLLKNTGEYLNIKQFKLGLSDKKEKKTLYSNVPTSGLASVYKRRLNHFNIEFNTQEQIELTTLDEFCFEYNIKKIHFLKMDVEGHEIKVLNGAINLIKAFKIDFIQFEFGGCNIDSRTFFQDFYYLLKDQYRIYRIVKNGLFEIKSYKETQEVFLSTNFLAERISE